jgi:hypothetical protein
MKKEWIPQILSWCCDRSKTNEYIQQMYPRENPESMFRFIWKKRILVIAVIAGVVVFSGVYGLLSVPEESRLTDGRYITRGEEEEEVTLTLTGTTDGTLWEKNISITVKERQFSKEEKKKLTVLAETYLAKTLPGKNASLEQVYEPLQMPVSVPDTGISVQWTFDDTYLKESGAVKLNSVPEEGIETELMAKAVWKNWKKTFYYPVHLYPKTLTAEQNVIRTAKDAVKQAMKEQADKEVVELPLIVADTEIAYETEAGGKDFSIFYFGIFTLFFIPVYWWRKQKKEMQERENQLLLDHPAFVNRVMLLLSAGLTVRKTIERLADEYEANRKKGGEIRYVYEELCVMAQEIRDGVSESRAMERFGRRCRLLPYLRFSSVITQNLKKGADGIIDILEKESMEALEQRKERVLQLGEMAGTKLLFPMILMLGIVMGIIMVPVFMTM